MRLESWLAVGAFVLAANSSAQIPSSGAYPINTAAPHPPLMYLDQKDRTVELEVTVAADGRTISSRLLTRSGSGIFDERVRGYWKLQPFVPALDAAGRPRETTLRIRNTYSFEPMLRGGEHAKPNEGYHFAAEILDRGPEFMVSRVERMTCRDLLWEYDFMRAIAPKAKLNHEQIFHVAFAMLIAAKHLENEARDALIEQWDTLIEQTLDSCRAQPTAPYWKVAFTNTFASALPVGVNVR